MAKRKVPTWVWVGSAGILAWLAFGESKSIEALVLNVMANNDDFINKLWSASASTGLSANSRAILVAQAAYESGWGRGTAAVYGHNYWNVTAGPQWTGATVNGADSECDKITGLLCMPITQAFRKYDSDAAAVADLLDFLQNQNAGRYQTAYAYLVNGDASGYIYALHDAGYFTANAASYAAAVSSIQRTVLSKVA
jgi:flagellum-specific peptidoglycan hydrolase FlgJ